VTQTAHGPRAATVASTGFGVAVEETPFGVSSAWVAEAAAALASAGSGGGGIGSGSGGGSGGEGRRGGHALCDGASTWTRFWAL